MVHASAVRVFGVRTLALCLASTLCVVACARKEGRIEQHRKILLSLTSTTRAIGAGWLAGHLSGTYTKTALDQTLLLVEQERATVVRAPESLADPRGARLSADADELERVIAQIIAAVRAADSAAARRHVASLARDKGHHGR